jgi:hypothetical protein
MEYYQIRKKYIGQNKREARKDYQDYKVAMEKKKMNNCVEVCTGTTAYVDLPKAYLCSLGTVEVTQPPASKKSFWGCKQEEGNNPMNYATATVQAGTTETQDQRKYLTNRLQEVYSDKRDPLEAAFGLTDDDAPKGPLELAERLKDGKFTVRYMETGTNPDVYRYWHWTDLIQWRDPAAKRDEDGFKKAIEELRALHQAALDTIKIDEPKAGLEAIKALEAWKPTGAAN